MPWRRRRACLEVEVASRGKRRDDAGAADLGWRSGEWRVRGAILEGSNKVGLGSWESDRESQSGLYFGPNSDQRINL